MKPFVFKKKYDFPLLLHQVGPSLNYEKFQNTKIVVNRKNEVAIIFLKDFY